MEERPVFIRRRRKPHFLKHAPGGGRVAGRGRALLAVRLDAVYAGELYTIPLGFERCREQVFAGV